MNALAKLLGTTATCFYHYRAIVTIVIVSFHCIKENAKNESIRHEVFGSFYNSVVFTCHLRRSSGELSLLLEEDNNSLNVLLVQWTRKDLSKGRVVTLDVENKIVCPVNFISPRSFLDTDIILPAVGEAARRVKKPDRPYLPTWPLRLKQMFAQAIAQHSHREIDFAETETRCGICSVCDTHVMTCAFCLQSVHPECCNALCDATGTSWMNVGEIIATLAANMIPNIVLAASDASSSSSSSCKPCESPWRSCFGLH